MSIRDQVGVFFVTRNCIDDTPEMVMKIMGRCVVVGTYYHYARDMIEYTAISPEFDRVELGSVTPEYSATIEEIEGHHQVSFKRVSA